MLSALGGMMPLAAGTLNPLASVPWVAQWKFNNNGNDSIGSNNLTNNNSATFTTGKLSQATQLVAASSQSWTKASNATLQAGSGNFLVACWVNGTTLTGGVGYAVVSKDAGAGTREFTIAKSSATNLWRFIASHDGTNNVTVDAAAPSPSVGTWYLIVCWYDGANININVNNGTTYSAALAGGLFSGAAPFSVGSQNGTLSFFDGAIDNVCLAKGTGAVATPAILTALYNSGNGTESIT